MDDMFSTGSAPADAGAAPKAAPVKKKLDLGNIKASLGLDLKKLKADKEALKLKQAKNAAASAASSADGGVASSSSSFAASSADGIHFESAKNADASSSSSYSFVPGKSEKFSMGGSVAVSQKEEDDDPKLLQEYDPLEPNNYDVFAKQRKRKQNEKRLQDQAAAEEQRRKA